MKCKETDINLAEMLQAEDTGVILTKGSALDQEYKLQVGRAFTVAT